MSLSPLLPERNASRLVVLAALALPVLTGCARAVVTTDVNADGTWKRTVKLYAAAPDKNGTNMGGTLDDNFALPQGPGWKTSRALDSAKLDSAKKEAKKAAPDALAKPAMPGNDMEVYTAVRTCAPGETLTRDVAIKSPDGKVKAVQIADEVTVHALAPDRIEYRETVHWVGKTKPPLKFPDVAASDKEMLAQLNAALPKELVTPEKAHALMDRLIPEMWRAFFGPNDPLIAEMFTIVMFPDAMKLKLQKRFGAIFDRVLADTYGSQLTVAERHAAVRRLVDSQSDFLKDNMQKKMDAGPFAMNGPGNGADAPGGFVSMTFSVKLPGRIVETNGDADPITDEVSWIFYSPAVLAGDVVMRAVCETH